MLVDSHCHLDRIDLAEFQGHLTAALDYASTCGVDQFLCISTGIENFAEVRAIAEADPRVHCTVGLHPLSETFSIERLMDFLMREAEHPKVVGIGETGLDGYYAKDSIPQQLESFKIHFEAARQLQLPLVIHTREAKRQTLEVITSDKRDRPGVLHCFTEDWEMAKKAMDAGYYISISGIVTFRQADNVREVARKIPLDRLLVETDSPYLAPVPHRGKPCQPAYTRITAEFLAELRRESIEQLAEATTENYFTLFNKAKKA